MYLTSYYARIMHFSSAFHYYYYIILCDNKYNTEPLSTSHITEKQYKINVKVILL